MPKMFVSKVTIRVFILLIYLTVILPIYLYAEESNFDNAMKEIANKLAGSLRGSKITKVAVLEPETISGEVSELGVLISESVIGYLFENEKGLRVIERRLLSKILEEHGFTQTGLVDEKTIQKLGNILGVEGIVIGTIAKVDKDYRVNLRLLDVKTAEVIAVSRCTFLSNVGLDNAFVRIVRKKGISVEAQPIKQIGMPQTVKKAILDIDWKYFEEGDFPDGYGGLRVFKAFGGKVLATPSEGDYSFEIATSFPSDFRLFTILGGSTGNSNKRCFIISLIGSDGDLGYYLCPHPVGGGRWDFGFLGTNIKGSRELDNDNPTEVELQKKGDVYKLYIANNMVLSLKDNKISQFNGIKIKFQSNEFGSDRHVKGHFISKIKITDF